MISKVRTSVASLVNSVTMFTGIAERGRFVDRNINIVVVVRGRERRPESEGCEIWGGCLLRETDESCFLLAPLPVTGTGPDGINPEEAKTLQLPSIGRSRRFGG